MEVSRINKKRIIKIIILFNIIFFTSTLIYIYFTQLTEPVQDFTIEIRSDEDFEKYGFPGSGTEQDPYRIENYTIQTSNSWAISICDVSKHFRIWNNVLDVERIGIYICNVEPNITQILSNIIFGGDNGGIIINNVDGGIISDNTCYDNFQGINLENSANWQLRNNTLKNNRLYGVYIIDSLQIIIENNTLSHNAYSGGSYYNIGVLLERSPNVTIQFNSFKNHGLTFSLSNLNQYSSIIVENNTVNDLELGYFFNYNDKIINNPKYGQILLINCSNVNITNQFINHTGIGLDIDFCNNCSIYENNFCHNRLRGISLYKTNDITLCNNTFYKNMYGIGIWHSNNTMIKNCFFESNNRGCYSGGSDCSVFNCEFYNNNLGYHANNFQIILEDIINSSIFDGNFIGIELYGANGNIKYNEFYNNDYGCYIVDSDYELFSNIFANNIEDIVIE
jgi:parallel beta-helix repeat protein